MQNTQSIISLKNTHSLTHFHFKKKTQQALLYLNWQHRQHTMKVISVEKSQSKVGGEMMKSSLQQKSQQHDTIIANILRLQFQYQQQHTSASSSSSTYTHSNNNTQNFTRFSKLYYHHHHHHHCQRMHQLLQGQQ